MLEASELSLLSNTSCLYYAVVKTTPCPVRSVQDSVNMTSVVLQKVQKVQKVQKEVIAMMTNAHVLLRRTYMLVIM